MVNKKKIQSLKDQQLIDLEHYVNQIENTYEQLRYFQHDFKNILISLNESIKTNDINLVRENYQHILKSQNIVQDTNKSELNFPKLNNIKNMLIKSILYAYLVQATQKRVPVTLEVTEPIVNEPIDTFDYVRLLSILLDNALEEAEKYPDGVVHLCFIKNNDLTVIIENTCHENYKQLPELFKKSISSKGKQRGLGLASAEMILNKYKNISLETQVAGQVFTQKMIMKW
ncbi:GHKL domain-containing protein [Lactobacillus sp. DCY120]|uniref:GHKL domain-containing protein n=1 Tax=Bombilactobacillus apium TaxID=2675299 RepID=A0A850RBF3_9LACO|nr:GHKL domain-containing protein [Bombilactobacillus apium]NVY96128.1 GHKL domain-containing protein [Bombilactobacillus apium]